MTGEHLATFGLIAGLMVSGTDLKAQTGPVFPDDRSIWLMLENCSHSLPDFAEIAVSAAGFGFDVEDAGGGARRYRQPISDPNTVLEVHPPTDGQASCFTTNRNIAPSAVMGFGDAWISANMRHFGPSQPAQIVGATLALYYPDPVYDLWLSVQPAPDGGTLVALQVAGLTDEVRAGLDAHAGRMAYRPHLDVFTDLEMVFNVFCRANSPEFENGLVALASSGATVVSSATGHAASWPGLSIAIYLENVSAAGPARCQVSAPFLTLAEANDLGRRVFTGGGQGAEQNLADGTRMWFFDGPMAQTPDTFAFSYRIPGADGHGLAIQFSGE